MVVVNKAEGKQGESGRLEAYSLGLGEPVSISAEHGEGLADLYEAVREALPKATQQSEPEIEDADEEGRAIRVAVVGRPNAGKSTLINRLLGEDRMLTGPEPGITRDAIAVELEWQGRSFRVHDTAGILFKQREDVAALAPMVNELLTPEETT